MTKMLYGKDAALARARLLTDYKWTPVRDVPTYTRVDGNCVLLAGTEVTGFPYSGVEPNDKFLGENVSIETFLSAVPNPDGTLYQPGKGKFGTCNYGIVCNGLVRYALGIPERVSTRLWNTVPGMRTLKPKGEYSVDEMETGDVLHAFNDGRNHVAMITDLERDGNGRVTAVEVSEAVRPTCVRRRFTPEQYYEKYKVFALQRYDFLDDVPPLDADAMEALFSSGIDKIRPKITVDHGDKSNYLLGDAVAVSVFADAPDTVQLLRDGEVIESYPVSARALFPLTLARGYYTARLKNEGSEVRFAVMGAMLSHEVHGDEITVYFDACDERSIPTHLDFRMKGEGWASLAEWIRFTDADRRAGQITHRIHPEAENYKVSFRNEYGIWTMPMKPIFEN